MKKTIKKRDIFQFFCRLGTERKAVLYNFGCGFLHPRTKLQITVFYYFSAMNSGKICCRKIILLFRLRICKKFMGCRYVRGSTLFRVNFLLYRKTVLLFGSFADYLFGNRFVKNLWAAAVCAAGHYSA